MSTKVRALLIHAHGEPTEVLRLEEIELPPLEAGEVLIRTVASPINPADLNFIEGKYPVRPVLPATPGVEGAGRVEETGAGEAG